MIAIVIYILTALFFLPTPSIDSGPTGSIIELERHRPKAIRGHIIDRTRTIKTIRSGIGRAE